MTIIEQNGIYNDSEDGMQPTYHYFNTVLADDKIIVEVTKGPKQYLEKYLDIDATWHIPVQKVPEIIRNITECFYTCDPYKDKLEKYYTDLGDSYFIFEMDFYEIHNYFHEICIGQTTSNHEDKFLDKPRISQLFKMQWNDKYATPMEIEGKRIMPRSLAAFLEGLKKTYNTWQKDHPDFEKIK